MIDMLTCAIKPHIRYTHTHPGSAAAQLHSPAPVSIHVGQCACVCALGVRVRVRVSVHVCARAHACTDMHTRMFVYMSMYTAQPPIYTHTPPATDRCRKFRAQTRAR